MLPSEPSAELQSTKDESSEARKWFKIPKDDLFREKRAKKTSERGKFREMLSQRVVPPGITPVLGDGAFGIPNASLAFGAMDLIRKK